MPDSSGPREAAFAAVRPPATTPEVVRFTSTGTLLITGAREPALATAESLRDQLDCVVHVPGEGPPVAEADVPVALISGGRLIASGWLGAFSAEIDYGGARLSVTELVNVARIDLLLDLGEEAPFTAEVAPLGYFAAPDGRVSDALLATLVDMRGTFEKPRFFDLDTDICAHGRSGLSGCRRCIDACPTEAIVSAGDHVAVNPHLCQGGGSCATACPSGAIVYTLPPVSDLLTYLRRLLAAYAANGGSGARLVLHDEQGADRVAALAAADPSVLGIQLEEVGSAGLEAWLAGLAYGAASVSILVTEATPGRVLGELAQQIGTAGAMLEGLGYGAERVGLLMDAQQPPALADTGLPAATFAAGTDKRATLELVVDHLCGHAPARVEAVALPAGAPLGRVRVDEAACTLCMACVAVCPPAALVAGDTQPQLGFFESQCVQCGLCASACPEDAIEPEPRLLTDAGNRRARRVLHEEEPFACIACGKLMGTRSMLDSLREKLAGHRMFATPAGQRRLEMCADCRVKDLFDDAGSR